MAFLKFNKAELVNLSYSLRREIICANKTGAYCNTSILTCNTRRYHGLLAVTLDRFGGDRYLLLSSLDESLVVNGKQFNLGIHCYGDIYEPRGHKYVVDFGADPVPQVTCKVGEVVFRKSLLLDPGKDRILIRYELVDSPAPIKVQFKPFLAFRCIHALTHRNDEAVTSGKAVSGGMSFRMYEGFPELCLQFSDPAAKWTADPQWNMNITYSDEYRRGFDCREDLLMPGHFTLEMKPGQSVVFSASTALEQPSSLEEDYGRLYAGMSRITSYADQLRHCADLLITNHNGRKKIHAGYSWLYTGLLRETLLSLPGLALYGLNSPDDFEEILDNLIADEKERLFRRTTQVEAPLSIASVLQAYIDYGADPQRVWKKYGDTVKGVVESYLPGVRREVTMHPNGLLWAQMDGVALSWMNAYVDGRAVTERAGYQVETNALWYNCICFSLEMEARYGAADSAFVKEWKPVSELIRANFQKTFWNDSIGRMADYVGVNGPDYSVRPNQITAVNLKYIALDDEIVPLIVRAVDSELLTSRGIRTLSPRDAGYRGVYEGSQIERDLALHNGCAHPSLLSAYVEVSFRLKGPAFWKKAEWLTEGFYQELGKHGVGAFSELYDGDPPHEPHGAISSSLSTAALLTVNRLMEKYREE